MPESQYAPRPFAAAGDTTGDLWAFPKFTKADYVIKLDLNPIETGTKNLGTANVTATIEFESFVEAKPVIEFLRALSTNIKIELNGTADTDHQQVIPVRAGKLNSFFGIDKKLDPGSHTLVITYETPLLIRDSSNSSFMLDTDPGVYWHFRMSDGRPKGPKAIDGDCNFLGRYLPTNLEFDAHPKSISLEYDVALNSNKSLRLFTNGKVNQADVAPVTLAPETSYEIKYPADFRSSSVFFYLADPDLIKEESFALTGHGTGQTVTIFGRKTDEVGNDDDNDGKPDGDGFECDPSTYKAGVEIAAAALMADFNRSFPYDHVLLYSGRQGMEYAGAAEISGGNILHELFHLFVGRWVVPADGPSGWWDEALAHWYVSGKNSYAYPPDASASIGGGPKYRRWTSGKARTTGAMLIGFMDYRLRKLDNPLTMTGFIRELASARTIKPLNTKQFRKALIDFSGKGFKRHFERYVGRK